MRIHTGVGHTDNASAQMFPRKNSQIFLVLLTGSKLGSLDLESDALPVEPPRHPVLLLLLLFYYSVLLLLLLLLLLLTLNTATTTSTGTTITTITHA